MRNPQSPTRLAMNALLPAFEFAHEGRPSRSSSYQKPTNRYEHSPTPSQPINSIKYESPLTRIIMAAMNRLR
ncbi:MAG: hypothetical protein JFAIHJKO_01899 [Pyrinomonadaceae bacterium]|nr:hypothetical protein [Pyrinomonadaceae bacterium]